LKRRIRSIERRWVDPLYPVESPTIYGGDEEKKAISLLGLGFKARPFITGFTALSEN